MSADAARPRALRLRLLQLLRKEEGALLALLAVAVVALTFWGATAAAGLDVLGALHAGLRSLVGGNVWGGYGWQGNLASLLGLLLVFRVATKAAMLAFAARVDSAFARHRHGHSIVCGLGERGKMLAEALLRAGDKVTVLELDEKNPHAPLLRAQGARVVTADATTLGALQLARADTARRMIAVLPSSDQNAAAARAALQAAGDTPPTCYVHNADTSIWSALFDSAGRLVVPFSVTDSSCIELFLEYDLSLAAEGAIVAVYGTGPLAESIIIRAAKVWQAESLRRGEPSPLPVRVIGPGARDLADNVLALRYPGIERLCAFAPVEIPSFAVAEDLAGCSAGADERHPTVAIVATGDQDETVRMALLLARWLPAPCQVVAAVPSAPGLLQLLLERDEALAARLKVVDLGSALAHPATLLGGTREELARLAHEDWLRSQVRRGCPVGSTGPLQHWEDLPDEFKVSNRSQVAALFDRMLPEIRAQVVPLAEWDAAPFVLLRDEVETLARLEHERWCEERTHAGWTLDRSLLERDSEGKRTPWLVDYEELPESQKDNDREAVTRIPVMLARAGFRLKRADSKA